MLGVVLIGFNFWELFPTACWIARKWLNVVLECNGHVNFSANEIKNQCIMIELLLNIQFEFKYLYHQCLMFSRAEKYQ